MPVSIPTSLTVHVDNGDNGGEGPTWLTALGGFLVGVGALGTMVIGLRRRLASPRDDE